MDWEAGGALFFLEFGKCHKFTQTQPCRGGRRVDPARRRKERFASPFAATSSHVTARTLSSGTS